jgi:hypothetical protein
VTLTVTWSATFTIGGQSITLPPIVMPPTTYAFVVHETRGVLVTN